MKYLIAFDLDGTLLTDDKQITEVSKNYIQKLIDDGHTVVIATGRPYAGMSNYYKELNLKTPIVNTNGGTIHNPNDDNFETVYLGIDRNKIIDICNIKEDCINDSYFSYGNRIYYTSVHERLKAFIHIDENSDLRCGKMTDIIDVDPSGIILVVKPDKYEEFEEYITDKHPDLSLRRFRCDEENYLYELYQKSISKANGLQIILDYYNIDEKNLIAFGDGNNDVEMLEFAYTSVAMVNGHKEAIEASKYITVKDNNNDGAVHFLDHFLKYNTMK